MDLTESELCEEIPKLLSAENRHLPQNLVIYSFKDGGYIPIPKTTNVVTIFEYEGTAIHVDSAEAKAQIARDGGDLTIYLFNELCSPQIFTLEMGIDPRMDPRLVELRSGSHTGATTPDIDRPGTDGEQPADAPENEEGEEGDGKFTMLLITKEKHFSL